MTRVTCRAVLLDCDGVLVDSAEAVASAWTRWAGQMGLDPRAVTAGVHGRRAADTVAAFVPRVRRAAALRLIDAIEADDAVAVTAIPGAASLLAALPDGRWAVVTSGRRDLARARLQAAGLRAPAVLVTGDDVARGKPDPEGYLRAARLLGVPPHRCAVVEDAPAGVRAARAAGVGAVVGVGPWPAADDPVDATVVDLRGVRWGPEGLEVADGDAGAGPATMSR